MTAVSPYWHKFRVHLDWKSDNKMPEGFYLVWHRLHLGHPHL